MTNQPGAGDLLATYLRYKKIQVFEGVTPLFDKTSGEEYDFSPVTTTFRVSPTVGQVTQIKNIDTIKSLGYAITSTPVRKAWFTRQQVEHRLVPYRPGLPGEAKTMPITEAGGLKRIYAELDSAGRLRLVSKNASPTGYGPWVQTSKQTQNVYRPRDMKEYLNTPDSSTMAIRSRMHDANVCEDITPGPDEIPVLITSDNELVCIKLEHDIFHLGVIGTTGCIPKTQEALIKRQGFIQKLPLGNVTIGDEISCELEGKILFKPVIATFDKGKQPLLQIKTRMGILNCTPDHELLTIDNWGRIIKQRAETFKPGDILTYANRLPREENITTIPVDFVRGAAHTKQTITLPLNKEFGFLIGMYLAEGNASFSVVAITNSHPVLINAMELACKLLKLSHRLSRSKNRAPNLYVKDGVHHWFKKHFNSGSGNKSIPSWVYNSPKEFQLGLIDGYLSGDGYVDTVGRVSFTTKSSQLWEGMQILLLQHGIKIYKAYKRNLKYGTYYEGNVDMAFNDKLPTISHPEKQSRVKLPTDHPSMYNILPIAAERIREIIRKYSLMKGHKKTPISAALLSLTAVGTRKKSMGKPRAEKLLHVIDQYLPYSPYPEPYLQNLKQLVHSDLGFARITSIEPQTAQDVCDITVQDAHNFLLLGLAGGIIVGNSGKTLTAHAIIDRIFWRTQNHIAILNDSVNQCYAWRKPMTTPAFCDTIRRFKETPRGLPVAIFVPNSKNVIEIPFENELAFRETINWEWIVNNWKLFLEKSPWELGLSEKYFRQFKNDFLRMEKLEQLQRFFQDKAETKEVPDKTADKICATLADMWDRKFIDRSVGAKGKWHYNTPTEHYETDPYVGALRAGLIPVLNTVDLKDQHYHPQYTKYKIDQVKQYQLSIPTSKRKKLFLFFDEMGDIYKKGNDITPAGKKMIETITQGRNFQIGAIYTIQNYTQLHPEIRNNTGYFFCFTMTAAEEGRALAKNLGLSKELGDRIVKLPHGQCIAASNSREWIVYTPYGEKYRATGAIEGTPLPPLSMHYRPGDEL